MNPPEPKTTCAAASPLDLGHSRCGKKSPLSVTIVEGYVTCIHCRPDLRPAPAQSFCQSFCHEEPVIDDQTYSDRPGSFGDFGD